jgi:hypothetical protein
VSFTHVAPNHVVLGPVISELSLWVPICKLSFLIYDSCEVESRAEWVEVADTSACEFFHKEVLSFETSEKFFVKLVAKALYGYIDNDFLVV